LGLIALKAEGAQALIGVNKEGYFTRNLEAMMNMRWIYNYGVSDLIAIMILIVSSFFFIPVFYVLWMQIKHIFIRNHN
jgi:hypothetical protein